MEMRLLVLALVTVAIRLFWERERGDLDRHRPPACSGQKAVAALGPLAGGRCCCDDPRPAGGEPLVRRGLAER